MPVTRVCSSTSISTTPRPSRRSGAPFREQAIPPSFATLPGLARLLEQLPADANGKRNGAAPQRRPSPDAGRRRHGAPRRARPSRPRRPDAARSGAARRRRGRDGARQGAPHARPSRRAARPARLGADRRPGARPAPARAEADARAPGAHPGRRSCASTSRATRSPRRCRSSRRPTAARWPTRSSTSRDHEQRVWLRKAIESWRFRTPLERRRAAPPLRAPLRGRGDGALPPPLVPRPEAVLARGLDVLIPMLDESIELAAAAGAREVVLGHGAPRAAQRPRAHDRHAVRADPARVRGRADDRGRRRRRRGRHRATSSTTSAPRASATPRAGRSRSRSPRTRATSRRSTRSSRG